MVVVVVIYRCLFKMRCNTCGFEAAVGILQWLRAGLYTLCLCSCFCLGLCLDVGGRFVVCRRRYLFRHPPLMSNSSSSSSSSSSSISNKRRWKCLCNCDIYIFLMMFLFCFKLIIFSPSRLEGAGGPVCCCDNREKILDYCELRCIKPCNSRKECVYGFVRKKCENAKSCVFNTLVSKGVCFKRDRGGWTGGTDFFVIYCIARSPYRASPYRASLPFFPVSF